jgi:thiamine pyrophosphokinase
MDGTAFVFLNGLYPKGNDLYVKRLLRKSRPKPLIIAVDGGIAFMQKLGVKPDCWISDLDSAPTMKKGYLKGIEVFLFSSDKEKTDAELAIDLCVQKGIAEVSVFGWEAREGEIDHTLGSLFLHRNLTGKKRELSISFLSNRQEVRMLTDDTMTIVKGKGRRLSVIPISGRIKLTTRGTKYPARDLVVRAGQTVAMRNEISAQRAKIDVTGTALVMLGRKS